MDRTIGIVILNYKEHAETIECLRCILKQEDVDLEIVVVDNGSDNGSDEMIRRWIEPYGNIEMIVSGTNLGYSKGNNLGIKRLLEKGITFIIVSNSDIVFTDTQVLSEMLKNYTMGIGVMTPIIRNPDGNVEMRTQYKRRFFKLRVLKHLINIQTAVKSDQMQNGRRNKYFFLSPGIQKKYNAITGCFFALTPDYLSQFPFLYPETFLYGEEIATLILNDKAGLLTAIVDTADIIHKRAASTEDSLSEGSYGKRKLMAESAKCIMKLLFMTGRRIKKIYS